jgi:hypothetical protein
MMKNYIDTLGEMLTDRGVLYEMHVVPIETAVPGLTCIVGPELAYHYDGKVGVNEIKSILDVIGTGSILVTDGAPSTHARRALDERAGDVNHFTTAELRYNVVRHPIQPRFELVRGAAGFDEYAQMSTSDPVARYFNARPGDVFVITRRTGARAYRKVH